MVRGKEIAWDNNTLHIYGQFYLALQFWIINKLSSCSGCYSKPILFELVVEWIDEFICRLLGNYIISAF